jgi:hypothetical protein
MSPDQFILLSHSSEMNTMKLCRMRADILQVSSHYYALALLLTHEQLD